MKNITCYTPTLPEVANRSAYVRAQIEKALSAGAHLKPLPPAPLRLTVSMPPALAFQLEAIAKAQGVAPGQVVGMLLAGLGGGSPTVPKRGDAEADAAGLRREQQQLFRALVPHLEGGRIVLAEAGTGTGKSRVLAKTARHLLTRRPGVPVIITAPAIHNLVHLLQEWTELARGEDPSVRPLRTATVLGRGQFIDREALGAFLRTTEGKEFLQVAHWLTEGCRPGLTADTARLAEHLPGVSGLVADLKVLAPQLPADRFALAPDDQGEAAAPYMALRDAAQDASVIFCTHAMVAMHAILQRRASSRDDADEAREAQSGILPAAQAYLVDEAHQLEDNIASTASRGLSFVALKAVLGIASQTRGLGDVAAEVLQTLARTMDTLEQLPDDLDHSNKRHQALWNKAASRLSDLHDHLSSLDAAIDRLKLQVDPYVRRQVRRAGAILRAGLAPSTMNTTRVSFSPIRRWPTLEVGPKSVRHILEHLWSSVDTAALVSGTLFLPTDAGYSAGYMAFKLAIPKDRLAETPPIQPGWITSPKLMLPAAGLGPNLVPPSGRDMTEASMKLWLAPVAKVVQRAAQSAYGGTLVLMSGYDRARVLGEVMGDWPGLIVQSSSTPLEQCRDSFIALARAGERPVWIATGSAWTGLDLRDTMIPDDRAHEDRLLSDLVLPNIPFGALQTSTHRARTVAFGAHFEFMQAAFLLRQGLGRLMRRPGLVRRRIWMLDGRLLVTPPAPSARQSLRVLLPYKQRETFQLGT
ncbi:type IV CRISPR-associated DEAD/DEAH-box helicase Csf4 [Xanthobacter aminoxidans]|uniref:Type IV CRISPR-associated DEAD/DEAH-box helicase Csf4 n=1 Tax=Xanthobacter aminoxidans TaxID=186280 RepID=A0ABW6ZR16_9HYPH